jgi:hypothetical protein
LFHDDLSGFACRLSFKCLKRKINNYRIKSLKEKSITPVKTDGLKTIKDKLNGF